MAGGLGKASALLGLAGLAVPVVFGAALHWGGIRTVLALAAVLLAVRGVCAFLAPAGALRGATLAVSAAGAALCTAACLAGSDTLALLYPVLVNAVFLAFFVHSLTTVPIAERFARLSGKPLDERALSYTRKATIAWCGFFLFNGSVSLATVLLKDPLVWTLWNGCLSYLAIGLMALGEYCVRRRSQAR